MYIIQKYDYVVGVDTHSKNHVFAIVDKNGTPLESPHTFSVTKTGFTKALKKYTKYSKNILFAVEGTSSYGETLTVYLQEEGYDVCEVKPPSVKSRGLNGKTDQIDAEKAAQGVLKLQLEDLIIPRSQGARKALRILLSQRNIVTKESTANKNTLNALVRSIRLMPDNRKKLSEKQMIEISKWKTRSGDNFEEQIARQEARRLASRILEDAKLLKDNEKAMKKIVLDICPELLDHKGCGAVSAAEILCVYSHKGRIKDEEAFAKLAGIAPIQASSGNTCKWRLCRFGDRRLNRAITTIVKSRMNTDPETMRYVTKRTADGLSPRDITRILKRYMSRRIFKTLEAANIGVDTQVVESTAVVQRA
jgi:transposase